MKILPVFACTSLLCPVLVVTGLLTQQGQSGVQRKNSHGFFLMQQRLNPALHRRQSTVSTLRVTTLEVEEDEDSASKLSPIDGTTDLQMMMADESTVGTIVAPVAVVSETSSIEGGDNNNLFELWKKRLITSEDAFSVHKIAAATYTVTSFILMGTAISRWMIGRQELFHVVPEYLIPVTYLFCLANLVMCMASIRMAYIHRRSDLASRNAFIGTAGSSIFSGYFLLWASPFAPDFMTTPIASQIGFGILVAWNVLFVTDTMIRAVDIIEGRRDRKQDSENASFNLEYFRYIASGAWGLPVVAVTGYICSVSHDHAWMMNVFDDMWMKYGHGIQASVFYNNVLASMAPAYGSLFVTLRDKKLVPKRAEWAGIALFALPALIWTIDVTVRILPYWVGDGIDITV